MFPITVISFSLGAFIVWMFCVRYFNEPKYPLPIDQRDGDRLFGISPEPVLPKLMTYRYRYNFYLWFFIFTVEAIYLVITYYLPMFIGNTTGIQMKALGYNAIMAALIITGVLPNLGFIKRLLEQLRYFFHERAKTPVKGQDLFKMLKNEKIKYSGDKVLGLVENADWNIIRRESSKAPNKILNVADFTSEAYGTVRANWAKLSYLLFVVDTWSGRCPWKSCISSKELGWEAIREMHRSIKRKISDAGRSIEDLNNEIQILAVDTYRMISCLLFMADRSCTRLNNCLNELGYPAYKKKYILSHTGNWPWLPYPPELAYWWARLRQF